MTYYIDVVKNFTNAVSWMFCNLILNVLFLNYFEDTCNHCDVKSGGYER